MSKPFEIVDLKRKHLPRVLELRTVTHRLHHERQPHVFLAQQEERATWAELLGFVPSWNPFSRQTAFGFGILIEDILAAYLLYYPSSLAGDELLKPFETVFIYDIAVAKEHQGKGLGRALLVEVKRRAEALNATDLRANIWQGNERSESLFNGHGYRALSTTFMLSLKPESEEAERH